MSKSIGAMRHRITIQKPTRTSDNYGGASVVWSTHVNTWAAIETKTQAEPVFAQQIRPETTHIVRCRYFAGITEAMRISFGSRVFKIVAVHVMDEIHHMLLIQAVEESQKAI